MQLKINPKSQDNWFQPLGKLVINFGTIDLLITLCNHEAFETGNAINNDLETKVKRLLNYVNSSNFEIKEKRMYAKSLNEVLKINGLRNSVFHSPIIVGEFQNNQSIVLITDVKKQKTIKLEDINSCLNKMVKVGENINELLVKLKGLKI